jgi:hypothetical protein
MSSGFLVGVSVLRSVPMMWVSRSMTANHSHASLWQCTFQYGVTGSKFDERILHLAGGAVS